MPALSSPTRTDLPSYAAYIGRRSRNASQPLTTRYTNQTLTITSASHRRESRFRT